MYKSKKAQAAMEFLMTYGWVLLAVVGILSALIFFGVQDLQRLVPERCEFLSGLHCVDAVILDSDNDTYPSSILMVIRNEIGFDIANISMTINGTCNSVMNTTGEVAKVSLINMEEGTYGFACATNLTGMSVKEVIEINFVNTETDTIHRKVGYLDMKD
ncbi:MAG: hypothetical protein ACE5DM_06035 [Candidatus Nanoarchaeia archaeon]